MTPGAQPPRWRLPGPIRLGVSSCLLGQAVRYNGGHKRDAFLVETLGPHVEWVAVCPEVELGMGVPREPVQLEQHGTQVAVVGRSSRTNHTAAMRAFARRRVAALARAQICGYVLKQDSPSCGLAVRVYGAAGAPLREGRGLFAAALLQRLPDLPVEEEGRLADPRLRANFIEQVFAYERLRRLFSGRWTVGELVTFHSAHKLQLLAHSATSYRRLGRWVAGARERSRTELHDGYRAQFMTALRRPATVRSHTNVLQHLAGYLKRQLGTSDRQALATAILDYRRGLVPLEVPLAELRRHMRQGGCGYLQGQTYLELDATELELRDGA